MSEHINTKTDPDWQLVADDVQTRLALLATIWGTNPPDPLTKKLRQDLIVPALRRLAEFCAMVTIEEDGHETR